MNAASKLALVLGPVTESDFFDHYWEKAPLHISRSSTEHFASLVSIESLESILSSQALFYPSVQLTQSNRVIDVAEYTDDSRRILAHRLIERHHDGATIVVSQAHEKIESLANFRRDIQSELKLRCQTNIYLSPTGQQGFNAHFDSHDVFILQIAGTKTFNFYEGGVELPFQHDGFQSGEHAVGAPTQSISLEPGDTLYIPRGVMHDAVATEQTSLHITLGVYAITLRDVLIEITQALTNDEIKYRKSMPREIQSLLVKADETSKDDLLRILTPELTGERLASALSSIDDAAAIDSSPSATGLLATSPSSFAETTVCQINHSQLISVERSSELIRLRTHGQILEFTQPISMAVEQLLVAKTITMGNLAGLDNDQKQALCTRLFYANLLIVKNQ
ncbi:cupin domain-containing protein [Granulosicoccus sp.]|nr:cupin domain-containing protein [Granulosicoccus sp.]MDB4224570.1 cupin domain-containing protein [Granulosicoccus sp.]